MMFLFNFILYLKATLYRKSATERSMYFVLLILLSNNRFSDGDCIVLNTILRLFIYAFISPTFYFFRENETEILSVR